MTFAELLFGSLPLSLVLDIEEGFRVQIPCETREKGIEEEEERSGSTRVSVTRAPSDKLADVL